MEVEKQLILSLKLTLLSIFQTISLFIAAIWPETRSCFSYLQVKEFNNGKEWYLPSTKWVTYWLIGVRGLWNTSFPILNWISNSIVEQDEGPKSTYWWNLIGGAKNPDSEFLGWRQWPRWIQFQCLTFGRKSAKSGCSRSQFRWYTGGSCPQPQSSNSNSMIYEIRIKFCANFAT